MGTIVAGGNDFVIVAECHPTLSKGTLDVSSTRGNNDLATLPHPNGGLMRALKAMDSSICKVVGRDRDIVLASLRHPAGHGERRGGGGDHASRPIGGVATVAYQTTYGDERNDIDAKESMDIAHGSTWSTASLGG
jgi:hypothetical protein